MKKLLFLMLFVGFHLVSYNQVIIKGRIFDKKTKEKICFATVYFDGSFVGTSSDGNGEFSLSIPHNTCMPLTVSAVGYYSFTLPDFSIDKPIIIHLTPKEYQINEVIVSDKSLVKKRKANLRLFKNIFLGTTENALNCEISNEQDISFNYGTDRDTLKAIVSKPIFVNNNALGYNATYYLNRFEYYRKSNTFLIRGNMIFNKDLASETTDERLYMTKRKKAYLGSRMHFFRALWANDLLSAGFLVKNSSEEKLKGQDIVIQETCNLSIPLDSNKKYLKYPTKLKISYDSSFSEITFLKPKVYFDEVGYFDSYIFWDGEMVTRRIGDMLPYEYKINE
tara:strand:- start:10191 stop:11198 length:1008 start_codon:yes stop_codon:yes gene_type:complete